MAADDALRVNLTIAQFAVATAPEAEVQALACAGSGKSRALAFRVARLIAEGAPAESIVAFTFTEKAAESLKIRIASALQACGQDPVLVGAMFIGTMHSWCRTVLGQMDARYRQFGVLDQNRFLAYLMSRYPRLGIADLRRAYGRQDRILQYFATLQGLSRAWSMMNDELLAPAAVLTEAPELGDALSRLGALLYTDQFIDFSLMQRLVVDALEAREPGVVRALEPLRHVFVDEYQDTNLGQERLVELMHEHSETLLVVGDDDQAIYGWRGADISNILDFATHYPGAARHQLDVNFRSTPAIVDAADTFAQMELGAVRLVKQPKAHRNPTDREFGVLWFDNRPEEATWVADRIQELLGTEYEDLDGKRGLTPGDFAILMRSVKTREQTGDKRHRAFTDGLADRGIAYTIDAGGELFERAQTAAVLKALELLRDASPNRDQVAALYATTLLPAFPKAGLEPLLKVFARWGRRIHTPANPLDGSVARQRLFPQQLYHELLEALDVAESGFDHGVMADLGTFSRIFQDIENVYVSVDSKRRFQDVLNFLQNVANEGYEPRDSVMARPDAVTVSTVHKAKGLEFPVVFVVDVEANRFPGKKRSYDGWIPQPLIQTSLDKGAYQTGEEDQARLFYTAITRAERYLYVSGSRNLPAAKREAKQSRYMHQLLHPEIRRDLLTPGAPPAVTPRQAAPRRRGDESVLPTTYSQIKHYLRCPREYLMREQYGFAPAVPELFGFGTAVHAAIGKLHERYPDQAPTVDQATQIAESMFHLKHVAASADPVNRPGAYERAKGSAARIVASYADGYRADFERQRQVELPFEIPVAGAVISGAIDLRLLYDEDGRVEEAEVVDFKTMEGGPDPLDNPELDWVSLALQVQLYAHASVRLLGNKARSGRVHLLKDGQRLEVPVDAAAVEAAVANVEWAVARIIEGDFPMRPSAAKCGGCDFARLCAKRVESFTSAAQPPSLHLPEAAGGAKLVQVAALSDVELQSASEGGEIE